MNKSTAEVFSRLHLEKYIPAWINFLLSPTKTIAQRFIFSGSYKLRFDYFRDETTDRKMGPLGGRGDLPIAGDFDSDGSADDVAILRPSDRGWYLTTMQTEIPIES
jgi:hypothetical protein